MVISLWAENESGTTPTSDELDEFADQFGHTFPVLADAGWSVGSRYEKDNGIPTQVLIAPGMELVMVDEFPSAADIEALLPE